MISNILLYFDVINVLWFRGDGTALILMKTNVKNEREDIYWLGSRFIPSGTDVLLVYVFLSYKLLS